MLARKLRERPPPCTGTPLSPQRTSRPRGWPRDWPQRRPRSQQTPRPCPPGLAATSPAPQCTRPSAEADRQAAGAWGRVPSAEGLAQQLAPQAARADGARSSGSVDPYQLQELRDAAVEQQPEDIPALERQATQRRHAEVPACIVNAFLGGLPPTDYQAASIVNEMLEDEAKLADEALEAIAQVFECAFIWYTDPHKRIEFEHRDTNGFVRALQ